MQRPLPRPNEAPCSPSLPVRGSPVGSCFFTNPGSGPTVAGYREAWLQWRAGARGVVFPFRTYGLRVYVGVCCAQAP